MSRRRHRHSDPRTRKAHDIVRDYALWSAGFGLLPLPVIDFAAITATQVKMVHRLAEHYDDHYWDMEWRDDDDRERDRGERDRHDHERPDHERHHRHHHDHPSWSHARTRAIIASLVGGAVPVAAGSGLGSLLKAIPVVGTALGTLAGAVLGIVGDGHMGFAASFLGIGAGAFLGFGTAACLLWLESARKTRSDPPDGGEPPRE